MKAPRTMGRGYRPSLATDRQQRMVVPLASQMPRESIHSISGISLSAHPLRTAFSGALGLSHRHPNVNNSSTVACKASRLWPGGIVCMVYWPLLGSSASSSHRFVHARTRSGVDAGLMLGSNFIEE